jgi:hypothetical protein
MTAPSWMLEDKEDAQLPLTVGELAINELNNCQKYYFMIE